MEPRAAIHALLDRYAALLSAKDLAALGTLHWQDEGFTHTWSSGGIDRGWSAYARRLEAEFRRMKEPVFRFDDVDAAVFDGRFAAVTAWWRCEFGGEAGARVLREGPVTFAVALIGTTWRIVADHYAAKPAGAKESR